MSFNVVMSLRPVLAEDAPPPGAIELGHDSSKYY
jgi:hypothetical protein